MAKVQVRRTLAARGVTIGVIAAGCITPLVAASPAGAAVSLCAPPADTVPPQVTGVSFSTSSLNLNSGPRTMTVTATATDSSGNGAASGVRSLEMFISGRGSGAEVRLKLTAGTTADGTWTGTYTLPKYAQPGPVESDYVYVTDRAGNQNTYDSSGGAPYSPNDIGLQAGWQTSLTISGTPKKRPPRTKSGKLSNFSFSPTVVNATKAPKNVHLNATFTGAQPTRVYAYFQPTSGRGGYLSEGRLKRSGKGWSGHVRVGRWISNHHYRPTVEATWGRTFTPYGRSYNADRIESKYFAKELSVTSGTDRKSPVLQGLTITPSSVNTVGGAQKVTVKAIVLDAKSGVQRVNVGFNTNNGNISGGAATGLYPYAGIGYETAGGSSVQLTHTSGNTWSGTATFRECEPSGKYRIEVSASDKANNYRGYDPKQLQAAGLQGTLQVTSTPGDIIDPYVYGSTASSQDATITLDFSEGVKDISSSTLDVYALRPAATAFQNTEPIASITCSNGHVTVACSGSDGLITSAVLNVPALSGKVGSKYEVYANLHGVSDQLTDGTGNPIQWYREATDVTDS